MGTHQYALNPHKYTPLLTVRCLPIWAAHLSVSTIISSYSGAHKKLLTKLRVHHGLLVANMVEGHHEGVLHAACGR